MACDKSELEKISGTSNRYRFFDKSQEGGTIIWQAHLIWENGSYRELSDGCVGIMADATWFDTNNLNEVRQNLCYQKVFAQEKLEDAVKQFTAARDALSEQASMALNNSSPAPEKNHLKELKKLRVNVRIWEKKLTKILELLNPAPQEIIYTDEEREKMWANQTDAQNFLEALSEIQI